MLCKTILAFAAVAIVVGAAAAHVPSAFKPKIAPVDQADQYVSAYKPYIKPAYVKGSIAKNCLDNQGECALVVR